MVDDAIGQKIEGVWLPRSERHLVDWMVDSKGAHREAGLITYQWAKQSAARKLAHAYIPDWNQRKMVDVGAHVGLWSMWWTQWTAGVIAFEPIPDMRTLYELNVKGRGNYLLFPDALGDFIGATVLAFNPQNTGNTHKATEYDAGLELVKVHLTTLDAKLAILAPRPDVGVIKIDCEGVEEAVVRGAENTIKSCLPLIIVEQKKGSAYYGTDPLGAVELLRSWGYRTVKEMSGDHIMLHSSLL